MLGYFIGDIGGITLGIDLYGTAVPEPSIFLLFGLSLRRKRIAT
jgi:hypothetical protein|tara:strand:+ start:148 stop:279 length:132 start_codon:yes stop_codon:yes gene_type:complete